MVCWGESTRHNPQAITGYTSIQTTRTVYMHESRQGFLVITRPSACMPAVDNTVQPIPV